ncbi:DUF3046 domain-containing protein [Microbacterium invictum]|uniref:DUF3046 domain-containing protein n=1 Tax=Microbacterium invictum TaxID=515415 RepID=A0ABZ0V9N3_9MICO|nr:DUF3046 domain-containing protein [Microbacterium invictum]WQB69290.1 DUF3046 domain-containing protein [Microbacterium invictum]
MRRSEFQRAVEAEFGPRGAALTADLVLSDLDGRTADEALAAGTAPREVWRALCLAADVPPERWYGVGRLEPRRG